MAFKGKSTMTWKEFCSAKEREHDDIIEENRIAKEKKEKELKNATNKTK